MKDLPSKMKIGTYEAVAGGSTSKSGGSTGKAIHAIFPGSLKHLEQMLFHFSCNFPLVS